MSRLAVATPSLNAITAYEMLFDHLDLQKQTPGAIEKSDDVILVTGATIIATASRKSSQTWVKIMLSTTASHCYFINLSVCQFIMSCTIEIKIIH